jgi:hypothetical protein
MGETIPPQFSGFLYAPSSENGVYLLMGLLWEYLPNQFAIEEFEIDPHLRGYDHTKYLDARAKYYVDGSWEDVTIEFKLYSSGLRRDVENHPGMYADFVVCWEHDAPDIEQHVGKIIALKDIFKNLPEHQRRRIILYPDKPAKVGRSQVEISDLLKRFSMKNREKIERLLTEWPQARGAKAEILFLRGRDTVFRACAYASEHIIVTEWSSEAVCQELIERFKGEQLQTSVKVPLDSLRLDDISEFVELMEASSYE